MHATKKKAYRNSFYTALLATVATTGLPALPAVAQTVETESSASSLDDIVVTARRREEALQSIPIALQAFSGEALAERNVQDATDLQKLVPSLTTYVQARDEVTVSIRGMSSSGASAQGQNPRVTAYFAQIPLQTGDGGGPGRFFDLQNVQILKGPQGTLFGRNSTGGAILYEPTRPKDELGGYVNAQLGRFHDAQIEGAINVPLHETVAVRLAIKHATRDGFTKNIVTGQNQDDRNYVGGRASLLWTPSHKFDTLLMFDYLKSDTNGSSQQIAGINYDHVYAADMSGGAVPGGLPLTLGGEGPSLAEFVANPGATFPAAIAAGRVAYFPDPLLTDVMANQQALGPRVAMSGVDGVSRSRGWGISSISTFHINDDLLVRNLFGVRRFKQMSRYDMDGTTMPLLDQVTPDGDWSTNIRQISEELQLQGKLLDDKLDFTIGGFLLWQKSVGEQRLVQATLGVPALTTSRPKEKSQSAFGQISYELIDNLKLTAGYRYTHDFRSTTAANYRDASWQFTPDTCTYINGCPTYVEKSFNSSSYNFGLDYQVSPETLLYATHRRGYRAGGLNPQAGDFGFAYDPEIVTDFEIGLKTDFNVGDMNGRLNLAAFHSKMKGAQTSQAFSVVDPQGGPPRLINLITNAAKAKVQGVETDFMLSPVRNLNLAVSYAYTDAKYTDFVDLQTGLQEDRPFPFLAKHRLSLSGTFGIDLSESLGQLEFGANWVYSSRYTISVFRDPLGEQPNYNQLDLRVDWKGFDDKDVTLGFFVNNVTNSLYLVGGVPIYDALGTTSVLYNEPRTWGVQFRYAFGSK